MTSVQNRFVASRSVTVMLTCETPSIFGTTTPFA
jgi:hypothetical protein